MSFQTFVTQRLAALTEKVNAISTNAKKIDELDTEVVLDKNALIHVSKNGSSKKISVQQIINAVTNDDNDHLLSVGSITLAGNDLTIASVSGKINNIVQSIPTPTIINIPYCATGLNRIDLIAYNTNNEIVRISGIETAGIVIAPTLPLETLLVTQITVSDSLVGNPSSPILGASYVKKSYSKVFEFNGTGSNAIIPLNPNGHSEIRLINSGLISISGVDLSLMIGANFESPYPGKEFVIWNKTGVDVVLNNEDLNADYSLFLRWSANIVLPNNHVISFRYDAGGLYEIDKSFDPIKLDKVTTQGVERVYTINPDGTQGTKSTEQKYYDIVANTTLNATHNNSILRIKATATVTISASLPTDFNFSAAIYNGATYTQVVGVGVTQVPASVSKSGEGMLFTMVDGINNFKTLGL